MMSLRTEYALRALYEIGSHPGPVGRSEISRKQNISPGYLEQILLRLKNRGLIRSYRGPGGGYSLAKEKSQISLWDIYSAVDNDLPEEHRCFPGMHEVCDRISYCSVSKVWRGFNERLKQNMLETTLESIS